MGKNDEFIKVRNYKKSYGRRFWKRLRASKSQREYRNYEYLDQIGIPCPGKRHYEDQRNVFGLLTYSSLSMERLPHATDLRYMMCLDEYAELRKNRRFRRRLAKAVAGWIRKMHDHGFYHLNLNFRNVMADTEALDEPKVFFIDMTSGKINPPAFRRHYMTVKELAFLYKDARKWCSPREMLLFYKTYMNSGKLTQRDRHLIAEIQEYAQNKWGDRSSTVND